MSKIRPDIYVQLVIDLYTDGKASFKDLKLQSSQSAKSFLPIRLRQADWLLFSSIKPEYDHPDERFDGITLPGQFKSWFTNAGYTNVVDNTNYLFKKDLKTLLDAQNDYKAGYTICLFVDADVFVPYKYKVGGSFYPNHWVVLNSDIRIRKYNEKASILAPATVINKTIVDTINKQIQSLEDEADFEEEDISTETDDRILLDAFTWGIRNVPVSSKISSSQVARLSYFLDGFYGYIKVKR